MTQLTLYGTKTSPYVRRVRIVARELGVETNLVDTTTEAGQAALRALNPIWKVPTARIDDVTLLDSAAINRHLVRRFGREGLALTDDDIAAQSFTTAVDGGSDALINAFYLAKDGVLPAQASYVEKQMARAASAMTWLDARLAEDAPQHFGLPEIALYCSVDWMRFRGVYDVERHPAIVRFMAAHAARDSVVATDPRT